MRIFQTKPLVYSLLCAFKRHLATL